MKGETLQDWANGRTPCAYRQDLYKTIDEAHEKYAGEPEQVIMQHAREAYLEKKEREADSLRAHGFAPRFDPEGDWEREADDVAFDLSTCSLRPWKKEPAKEAKKEEVKEEVKEDDTVQQKDTGKKDEELATIRGKKVMMPGRTWGDDLKATKLKPVEWIVDGVIPVGLTILAAPPKSYKSYMMLDLCASVAEGRRKDVRMLSLWTKISDMGCRLQLCRLRIRRRRHEDKLSTVKMTFTMKDTASVQNEHLR